MSAISSTQLPTAPAVVRERPGGETMRAIIPMPSSIFVGNSTILDSLDMLRRGGSACLAGWLGGLAPIGDFNPLARMASGVNFTFFASPVFGNPGFPVSDVPLSDIAQQVADGKLDAKPTRVFSFDQIREAHAVMEAGEAGGKMVVVMD